MMLRPRVAVTSLLVALPAALAVAYAIDRTRAHDMEVALDRVVRSQLNAQVKERCVSDPTWFLTGPLIGRPPNGVFIDPNPDALAPRPRPSPQPFELFAYDEEFLASSGAAPRFPQDFRRAMRASPDAAFAPHVTAEGSGVQMAIPTGWKGTPCAYFVGRMAPQPHQSRDRMLFAFGLLALCFIVALGATAPTVWRVRRLAAEERESASSGFGSIAPDTKKDELSSLTFTYNDAVQELQLRATRIDDLDKALRRFVETTREEVAGSLASLESMLGELATAQRADPDAIRASFLKAHDLHASVENLAAASRLRGAGVIATAALDLSALVGRVVAAHRPLAHAREVSIEAVLPQPPIRIEADQALVERAVANVIDNAIRYNRPGGTVRVTCTRDEGGGFRLVVADTGSGVGEEAFRVLTAVRRFRGDEHRNRRPGAPGLGLAVAQEVADRCGMKLELKRPATGGFEVEFSGAASQS